MNLPICESDALLCWLASGARQVRNGRIGARNNTGRLCRESTGGAEHWFRVLAGALCVWLVHEFSALKRGDSFAVGAGIKRGGRWS